MLQPGRWGGDRDWMVGWEEKMSFVKGVKCCGEHRLNRSCSALVSSGCKPDHCAAG